MKKNIDARKLVSVLQKKLDAYNKQAAEAQDDFATDYFYGAYHATKECLQETLLAIAEQEIADAAELGYWIEKASIGRMKIFGRTVRYFACSECGQEISDVYGLFPYCPYCGAEMMEE